jgi:hypothetical protein
MHDLSDVVELIKNTDENKIANIKSILSEHLEDNNYYPS